jgi:DNA-binding MarR family transcriptional regulator
MEKERDEIIKDLLGTFRRIHQIEHQYIFRNVTPKQKAGHFFIFMKLKKDAMGANKGLRVSDIAASLGVSVPAVTQILGELEKQELIRREMDPEDRRAVRVFMTEKASTIMKPAFDKLGLLFDGLIDYLGEENSMTLLALLDKTEKYLASECGAPASPYCPVGN